MIDLTARVAEIVARAGLAEGLCSVYVPHATAAIVVNENDDPNVCVDVLDALDRLIPAGVWRHDRVDGNAASHIQATILGPGETIPVRDGRLLLGTWQAVMLVELDGPRDAAGARDRCAERADGRVPRGRPLRYAEALLERRRSSAGEIDDLGPAPLGVRAHATRGARAGRSRR